MKQMVNFPTDADSRYRDTGENGMFVYAVVPYDRGLGDRASVLYSAPFMLVRGENLMNEMDFWFATQVGKDDSIDTSPQLLCCLLLGSTRWCGYDQNQGGHTGYWQCKAEDLTVEGQALLKTLEQLYGRPPLLLTFLDT